MYRAIAISLLSLVMTGCVGLGVGTYGKKELVRSHFSLAKERNQFSSSERGSSYTRAEIVEHWGLPDDTQSHEGCEVLIYKDGTSWVGAGAFVGVVPVPLAVPSGSYKNRFYLSNGVAVGLVQEYGEVDRTVGYTCGSNDCKGSAGAKVNEPEIDAEETVSEWCAKSLQ